MKNISLKLEKEFLKELEKIMKKHNYMTKTEFIRESIRDKMRKLEEKEMPEKKEKEYIKSKEPLDLSYVR
ncbi:MAG: ribbon-helix-helix domain-containing protein [Nanoarchaeota archaeon]